MEKLGYTLSGFIVGTLLGAGAAHALAPRTYSVTAAAEGTAWTKYHAAIPAQAQQEQAPTF